MGAKQQKKKRRCCRHFAWKRRRRRPTFCSAPLIRFALSSSSTLLLQVRPPPSNLITVQTREKEKFLARGSLPAELRAEQYAAAAAGSTDQKTCIMRITFLALSLLDGRDDGQEKGLTEASSSSFGWND